VQIGIDRKGIDMKYMTAKYDGTCSACGTATHAGERIAWYSRGVIECGDCMPDEIDAQRPSAQPAPVAKRSDAPAIDPALDWDDSEPEAGASIGGVSVPVQTAPVTVAPNGATMQPVQSDERDAMSASASDDSEPGSDATRRVVELSAARIARTVGEPAPDLDALTATVADLLVTLVNCLDRLDVDQCDALRAHALHYANGASGPRARLWQALARTVA
jgi:hypothetical protein